MFPFLSYFGVIISWTLEKGAVLMAKAFILLRIEVMTGTAEFQLL